IDIATENFAAARKVADVVASSFPASGITATDIAAAYAMTDDIDDAMKWYVRAFAAHESQLPRTPFANSQLTKLFADPGWRRLQAKPAMRDWDEVRTEVAAEYERGE